MRGKLLIPAILLTLSSHVTQAISAETIRVAIGTQDTTINTATGGLIIREEKLLEKYLPKDGKYKDVTYDIQWRNFTTGAAITNDQIAGKVDFGVMADFPGSLNGVAHEKAGRSSIFISVLQGSVKGSGNGIVVPSSSSVQSLAELKGKTISVPFASTSHGLLLRAIKAQGWNPDTDVKIIAQTPEVAGSALQSNQVDAHADFVPFAELFPWRGFARKIYDGSQANGPTFHGALVDKAYAEKYPEIVTAYLQAALEANRLIAEQPEKYSELIAKVTGVEAEVNYLFHGPLGLQTRDLTWKPEYRQAVATAIETLKLLKKTDQGLNLDTFVNDTYIKAAFKASGLDYDAQLKNYEQLPLNAKDAATGEEIKDSKRVAQIWVKDEPLVRHYAHAENALKALKTLETEGKAIRVLYAQDRNTGIKLLGAQAWFVRSDAGEVSAFLLKEQAEAWAKANGGKVLDYAGVRAAVLASN
ncbi:ABC transporter substrate-binding protein [Hyphomicrobium facile]|uniref:Putative aliphatic sulfonates-binding protein n=1 Tax=Hyphomicrobium facile TaxID=51670 RepID=A0A1I7MUR9_9HYPH|nr:ABC transporter substrate-binding protein [Hyphomicrobium facile]SFV26141.1 NitT/TauT family transport system substrate-binding protein [Hyphomicrobium facile]